MDEQRSGLEWLRRWLGRTSLRVRVRWLIALVTIASVLFVISAVTFFMYRSEQNVWDARQREAAQSANFQVSSLLEQVQGYVMLFGRLDEMTAAMAGMVLAGSDQPDTAVLPDGTSGEDVSNPVYFGEGEEATGFFGPNITMLDQTLIEVVRFDSSGTIKARVFEPQVSVFSDIPDVTQEDWFQAALNGENYLADVQVAELNDPYLIISAPARNNGVVVTRLDMQMLWNMVADIHFGDTGQVYVVNQNGLVVAHPDRAVVLNQTYIGDRAEVQAAWAQPMGELWRGTYTNFQGDHVMGIATPIRDSGWTVFTEVAQHEATQTTRLVAFSLTASLIVLGMVVYVFLTLAMQFMALTPLEKVRQGAFRMGLGHLDERIDVHTQDEIGALAAEFNRMAANLQQKISETELFAQKATEANEFKTNLIARVSHELRNPLGGIMGISEMLEQDIFGSVSDEQREAVGQIVTSAQYLTKLVGELLAQSRLERGRVALDIGTFNPKDTIQSIVAISRPSAAEKGIDLITEFDADLPDTVVLDQGKLEQVVSNLVSNAIKFTERGSVRVSSRRGDNGYWTIAVKDTGIGIPADAQPTIFEPFRQVDESITRKYGGFGLGLSIVKHLTVLMNGSIELWSQEGQGSCFTVTLPYSILGEATANVPDEPAVDALDTHPLVVGVELNT